MSAPKRVAVLWHDSAGTPGWATTQEVEDLGMAVCESIGFLIREDDTQIVIALSRTVTAGMKPFADFCVIPRCSVQSIKVLVEE